MTGIEPPRRYLAPASLAPGEGVGVILQDPDPIPPVLTVEVQEQAIPLVGGPMAAREGVGALLCRLRESHIIYLGLVFRMADRQPTPVNYGLRPVNVAAVCRHGPCGELNFTLRAWDSPSESHPLQIYHPRSLQRHGLL